MSTITARDFNQDLGAAKRSAASEPVIITDRGQPSHVLMSYNEYRRLMANLKNIVELLGTNDDIEVDFEPANITLAIPEL